MNNFVNDLGVAAFVLMHGFKIIRKNGNTFYFEVAPKDFDEFERLQMEYLNSDFHRFDSNLMAIKKMNSTAPREVRGPRDHMINAIRDNNKTINED